MMCKYDERVSAVNRFTCVLFVANKKILRNVEVTTPNFGHDATMFAAWK